MILKISQDEAAKIISMYLKNRKVVTYGEIEINHDDPYFTSFDVEVDFSLIGDRRR